MDPRTRQEVITGALLGTLVGDALGLPITMAPALGRHPAGLRELKAFRTAWYALSPPAAKVKAA